MRVLVDSPDISFEFGGEKLSLPAIAGSASVKEGSVFLTLTNSHLRDSIEVDLALLSSDGIKIKDVKARELTGKDVHDHNSVENPNAVTPQSSKISAGDIKSGKFSLPAHSVTVLELALGA